MRIAMFTPLPPTRSGIADYAVELLQELGSTHQIHVYVASQDEVAAWHGRGLPFSVHTAHEFVWEYQRAPHDLVVFQLGNAWCHDYMWPYLFRYPGLAVLHDAQLHHARAWSLLRRKRVADYRAELAFNHPELPPEAAEPAINGFGGPLYYQWPMLRAVIASARCVAVHNRKLASDLREAYPDATVEAIRMGVPQPIASDAQIAAVRARHGIPDDATVVSAFGAVSEEKRIVPLLRAISVARDYQPGVRVLLVGQALGHFDARAVAHDLRVNDIVTCTGFVPDTEVGAYLGASDIVSCLRWPSARETSASWLRAVAAGCATIVTDLAQQADVPTLDPRSWSVLDAQPRQTERPALAVSIDVLDEDHSLTLALKRLSADHGLRVRLGAAAAAYWRENHMVPHMVKDYEAVLERLRHSNPRRDNGPRHLRPDGLEQMRAILEPFAEHLPSPLI